MTDGIIQTIFKEYRKQISCVGYSSVESTKILEHDLISEIKKKFECKCYACDRLPKIKESHNVDLKTLIGDTE